MANGKDSNTFANVRFIIMSILLLISLAGNVYLGKEYASDKVKITELSMQLTGCMGRADISVANSGRQTGTITDIIVNNEDRCKEREKVTNNINNMLFGDFNTSDLEY